MCIGISTIHIYSATEAPLAHLTVSVGLEKLYQAITDARADLVADLFSKGVQGQHYWNVENFPGKASPWIYKVHYANVNDYITIRHGFWALTQETMNLIQLAAKECNPELFKLLVTHGATIP